MLAGEKTITIDASPEAVYAVLADIAGYPDWHPFFKAVDPTAHDGHERISTARCTHGTPVGDLHTEMAFTYAEGGHVQAERTGGDLKAMTGVFLLAADGSATAVTLRMKVDPGMKLGFLLRGPVEERVQRSVLDGALTGLVGAVGAGG